MQIEWLKFFLDVAKTGSLRASSNNLYISQPALGAAISSLEKELGYPLFTRSHTGMCLTPYGKETIPLVKSILENLEASEKIRTKFLDAHQNEITGILNIVTVPTVGIGILPTVITSFAQQYPRVELTIIETNSALGMEQVLSGQCDVGFLVLLEEETFCEDFAIEPLWQERLYAFMRKDHILAKKQSVALNTLRNYPLAIMSYAQNDFSVREGLFDQYGEANIVFRSNNHQLLQNYILNTDCIGLTHFAHVVDGMFDRVFSSGLTYLPVRNCPLSKFFALYRKDSPKEKMIQLFIEDLKRTVE